MIDDGNDKSLQEEKEEKEEGRRSSSHYSLFALTID
jgi:hypothetical protein